MNLAPFLDDLESRIDPATESELYAHWQGFSAGRFPGPIFCPDRLRKSPPKIDWPDFRTNETLDDFAKMILSQLKGPAGQLNGPNALPMVRANYGTPIMPALFGARIFVMPEATNTLPTSHPLAPAESIVATVQRLLDQPPPALDQPYASKVLECGRRFMAIKRQYPKIGQYLYLYHPDLQGPMDICEMLWGAALFEALYDHPSLVHAFLDRITDAYVRFLRTWAEICPFRPDGHAPHWAMLHKGHIMLRDDSAMNLSPAMFDEFVRPYDQRLLDEFGGGTIHACGKVDHWVRFLPKMPGVFAFNMSQPQLNDMETVFAHTVDQGIVLLGLERNAADSALAAGRPLHGKVHCW